MISLAGLDARWLRRRYGKLRKCCAETRYGANLGAANRAVKEMIHVQLSTDAELRLLQHETFNYFLHESNPDTGLVLDKTAPQWPCSIAATGLALAAYPVGVEIGRIERADAAQRALNTLRFFDQSPQGPEPDATGYKGFYYHFLDMQTGRRAWQCELSTIDSAFLLAGGLTAAAYFDANAPIGNGRRMAARR
jgi:hypothetical protein